LDIVKAVERRQRFWIYYVIILSITLFFVAVLSVRIGVMDITYRDILLVLLRGLYLLPSDHGSIEYSKEFVIVNMRLPRILTSILVGLALATAGCIFQAIFKNSLADPYVIGVSSGAALGAAVAIVLGLNIALPGISGVASTAFIFSLMAILLVYRLASSGNRLHPGSLLLAGVIVSIFLSALVSMLMVVASRELHILVFWLMGGFSHAQWYHVLTLLPVLLPCLVLIYPFSRNLNLVLLSEEEAQHLGVDVAKTIKTFLILGSLITAVAVSTSGTIGFVGLIVPHIMRILVGADHRILLPSAALGGAVFLTLCDILARVVLEPVELPVGIITALIGGPFFLYLLRRWRGSYVF